jgi:hypothetical protein
MSTMALIAMVVTFLLFERCARHMDLVLLRQEL